jgi:putative addiction module killer protein
MSWGENASLPAFSVCNKATEPAGEGVSELRLFFGSGYRVYFGEQDNQIVVLLCGGDKGSQGKDIEQAKTYWKEYLNHEHL